MIYTSELKDYVTTIEQSRELIRLGIDYKTKFVWYIQLEINDKSIRLRKKVSKFFDTEIIPAFLTDELLDVFYKLEPWASIHGISIVDKKDIIDAIENIKSTESGIKQ